MILSIINFIVCLAISIIDLFIHFGVDYKPGTTPSLSFWGGIIHNIMVFPDTMHKEIARYFVIQSMAIGINRSNSKYLLIGIPIICQEY